jgi:hypothetical protein
MGLGRSGCYCDCLLEASRQSSGSIVVPIGVVVSGLVCLKIKGCHCCRHGILAALIIIGCVVFAAMGWVNNQIYIGLLSRGSNTANCITVGPGAETQTLQWLYGDHTSPSGDFCMVCWMTFNHAGFAHEYKTLRLFRTAVKKDTLLIDQFLAARSDSLVDTCRCGFARL